jgi:hypothetical protein
MNEKQTELSEQLVASKHWRWMPGMLTTSVDGPGLRVETVDATDPSIVYVGDLPWFVSAPPDLDDPATIGCLLALVREAWGDSLHVKYSDYYGFWWVMVDRQIGINGSGPTEGETLAAALLGAP